MSKYGDNGCSGMLKSYGTDYFLFKKNINKSLELILKDPVVPSGELLNALSISAN